MPTEKSENDVVRDDDVKGPLTQALVALVVVALAIGLLVGGGALVATKVLGLGGGTGAAAESTAGASLYMPSPSITDDPDGPQITLGPGDTPDATDTGEPVPEVVTGITVTASPGQVSPMGSVTLAGTYPDGEGAILQVQRQDATGAWSDFPVAVSVVGGQFSTVVQSAQVGTNTFRLADTDNAVASDPVTFTVQ